MYSTRFPDVRCLRARLRQIAACREAMEEFCLDLLLLKATKAEPVLVYSAFAKSHSHGDIHLIQKELNKVYLNNSNSACHCRGLWEGAEEVLDGCVDPLWRCETVQDAKMIGQGGPRLNFGGCEDGRFCEYENNLPREETALSHWKSTSWLSYLRAWCQNSPCCEDLSFSKLEKCNRYRLSRCVRVMFQQLLIVICSCRFISLTSSIRGNIFQVFSSCIDLSIKISQLLGVLCLKVCSNVWGLTAFISPFRATVNMCQVFDEQDSRVLPYESVGFCKYGKDILAVKERDTVCISRTKGERKNLVKEKSARSLIPAKTCIDLKATTTFILLLQRLPYNASRLAELFESFAFFSCRKLRWHSQMWLTATKASCIITLRKESSTMIREFLTWSRFGKQRVRFAVAERNRPHRKRNMVVIRVVIRDKRTVRKTETRTILRFLFPNTVRRCNLSSEQREQLSIKLFEERLSRSISPKVCPRVKLSFPLYTLLIPKNTRITLPCRDCLYIWHQQHQRNFHNIITKVFSLDNLGLHLQSLSNQNVLIVLAIQKVCCLYILMSSQIFCRRSHSVTAMDRNQSANPDSTSSVGVPLHHTKKRFTFMSKKFKSKKFEWSVVQTLYERLWSKQKLSFKSSASAKSSAASDKSTFTERSTLDSSEHHESLALLTDHIVGNLERCLDTADICPSLHDRESLSKLLL